MSGFGKFITGLFVVVALMFFSGGCSSPSSSKPSPAQSKSTTPAATAPANNTSMPVATQKKANVPTYQDPRWPTTNPELLAIPESDRWYNASSKIGQYGTIAGPVKSV